MSAKIIGFINQKGGVGKSFASKIAANALSGKQYKKRILLIDCDEQDTAASMRKKDISMMQGEGKTPEFAYPIAQCRAENLTGVLAGKHDMHIIAAAEGEKKERWKTPDIANGICRVSQGCSFFGVGENCRHLDEK